MKKFFQIFAITAIAAGAYFVTASKQEVVDGDQVSVEMNVEMMSVAEASSPGQACIVRAIQACCSQMGGCNTPQQRMQCAVQGKQKCQ